MCECPALLSSCPVIGVWAHNLYRFANDVMMCSVERCPVCVVLLYPFCCFLILFLSESLWAFLSALCVFVGSVASIIDVVRNVSAVDLFASFCVVLGVVAVCCLLVWWVCCRFHNRFSSPIASVSQMLECNVVLQSLMLFVVLD